MGLIAGIAAGIAAAATAAVKFYMWLHERGADKHVGESLDRSTAVIINVATAVRAVWEALSVIGGVVDSRRSTLSAPTPLRRRRVWDGRTAEEFAAASL